MKYFIEELKRGFFSIQFLLAIIIVMICLGIGLFASWSSISVIGGVSFFLYSFSLGGTSILPILAPIIAALPLSHSYLEDRENNMLYAISVRTSPRNYFLTKIGTIGLVAFLALVIPLFFFFLINLFVFPIDQQVYMGDIRGAWSFLLDKQQWLYVLALIINSGIFALVYGLIGFVVTLFVNHKVATLVCPFVIYLFPSFVFPLLGLDSVEPVTTFDLTANTTTTTWMVYLQLFALLLCTMLIGYYKIKQEMVYVPKKFS